MSEPSVPAAHVLPASPPRAARLPAQWPTLLLGLLFVYVLATATLPVLLERSDLRDRRAATEADISRLQGEVRLLQDWNEGAQHDPLLRERLLDAQRLSPEAPGYRVLTETETPPAKKAAKPAGG
jgi:hypothetical protein